MIMEFFCERIDSGSLLIVEHDGMQFAHLLRDEELRGHFDKAYLFWKSALGLKFAALGLKKGRHEINDLSAQLEAMP